jgi:phage/plasmid-like protein (TIGR03299 family)
MPAFAVTNDLNWSVIHKPLYFTGEDGSPVQWEGTVAVVREDTGRCLGSVSENYETLQNSDLLRLVNPLVSEGLLTVENVGYLKHGAKVFAQARLAKEYQINGEDYQGFVTLLNGHTGNCSVAIGSTLTRVICGNTFATAYSDISEKYRHSAGVTERVLESTFVLDYVNGAMKTYSEYMTRLVKAPCSGTQFQQYLETVYQKPVSNLRETFVSQLNNLFYSGKGNEGKTFHDAFSAVTEYASNYSRKTPSGRFQYSQFGQGAKINNRALRAGLELAAV